MYTRKFSESFHELAEFCLQCDPSDRPNIARLLAHSFFKQCRKSDTTLLDILKPIKPLHQSFVENFEDQAAALSTEFVNLELKSCQWDFENT